MVMKCSSPDIAPDATLDGVSDAWVTLRISMSFASDLMKHRV
jgi:hypothetical protein